MKADRAQAQSAVERLQAELEQERNRVSAGREQSGWLLVGMGIVVTDIDTGRKGLRCNAMRYNLSDSTVGVDPLPAVSRRPAARARPQRRARATPARR